MKTKRIFVDAKSMSVGSFVELAKFFGSLYKRLLGLTDQEDFELVEQ